MNNQPIEKLWLDPQGALEVFDIWKTLQGEGPLTGMPAVFVRLAGCVLCCKGCDTDYTSKRTRMSVEEVLAAVDRQLKTGLVVLTGGEPLRQNVLPLIRLLLVKGRTVQIETNGTVYPWELPWTHDSFHVVCSPKTSTVNSRFLSNLKVHWKYVMRNWDVDPLDGLPMTTLGHKRPARPNWNVCAPSAVWVQPDDQKDEVKNKENMDACVLSCMRFGYRLSLQTHKILGLL